MDDALLRAEPAQLAVGDEAPPEAAHVGDDPLERAADDERLERASRRDADLGAATARERQPVPFEAVVGSRAQNDVRGRVVGIGVHRVRAVEPARRREANVARFERRDPRRTAQRVPRRNKNSPIFNSSNSCLSGDHDGAI